MNKKGLPLRSIKNFSREYIDKLAELYITTAEEFVSVTNTTDGKDRISSYLKTDETELQQLIGLAENSLPESVRKEMKTPTDTSQFGLGALGPETKKNTEHHEG